MKLTKSQLKQIIKEEMELAKEALDDDHLSYADLASRLEQVEGMLAAIATDYADSGWLNKEGALFGSTLGNGVINLLQDAAQVRQIAQNKTKDLTDSEGEI